MLGQVSSGEVTTDKCPRVSKIRGEGGKREGRKNKRREG